jgi:hypothetical protein
MTSHGPIRGNVFTETLSRNGLHNSLVLLLLGADRVENSFPFTVAYLEAFTGRRTEIAVLLLLPVFVAVRMFTDIPLLLRNLATDCLPRICLRGNLFTNTLAGNALTCQNTIADFYTKPSRFTFTSLYLVTALHNGYSSAMFLLNVSW